MDLWTVAYVSDDNVDVFGARVFPTEPEAKCFADGQPEGVFTVVETHQLQSLVSDLWTAAYVSDDNVDVFGARVFPTEPEAKFFADGQPEGVFTVVATHHLQAV